LLTHRTDLDAQSELSLKEKFFHRTQKTCIIFAVAAVAISGLDLMHVRPLEMAVAFAHGHRDIRLADWPAIIRGGINEISIDAVASPSVVVAIPAERLAMESLPALSPPKVIAADWSPVEELATARHRDAMQVAMTPPPLSAKATVADLAQRAQDLMRQARSKTTHAAAAKPVRRTIAKAGEYSPAAKPAAPIIAKADENPPPMPAAPEPVAKIQLASLEPVVLPAMATLEPPVIRVSLPETISVLPPAPPPPAPPSPAQRLHLQGDARAKAELCLAKAVYFEARDQPFRGEVAVAQVVMNRVFSGIYPRDVCGVVYQNASHHLACQFTFACDGRRKVIDEHDAWARARRIARETLDGQLYVPAVGTATHYHATYVHPVWVREMRRVAREGIHLFYRPYAWGSGADEPIWARAELVALKKKR